MKRPWHRPLPIALVGLMLLTSCGLPSTPTPTPSPALTRIRLPMGYIPNVQYAPFYVAAARGYFRDEGLAIDFDYSPETDGVSLLGANEVHFALASGEQVLLARAQGLPILDVMNWWQDYPVAVAAPVSSGIRAPKDLAGKRVGIPMLSGASYIGYRALLSAAGLPEDVARLEVVGFNQVEALLAGTIDAAVIYANNEPIQLEAQGMHVNVIRVADYVHLASNGLVTNEVTIRDHPELVRSMVRAMRRGLQDTLADPQTAFEICKQYVEGLDQANAAVQRKVLDASATFWKAPVLGKSDPASWENMERVLLEMGLLSQSVDVSKAFTNEFLPQP